MILVLPGALPPAAAAPELARRLPEAAPTLAAWLAQAHADVRDLPIAEYACTPLQAWMLQRTGYEAPPGVPLGSGWAVLEAGGLVAHEPETAVWLADLAHLNVTQQGVTLLDPAVLRLSDAEAAQLIETAQPLLSEMGFAARLVATTRLRLHLPPGVTPYAPTPQAAAGREVQSWWSQDAATRPWRRVLNMVQMAWHEHPVNLGRAQTGLPVVNTLWLFGGARPMDFASPAAIARKDGPSIAPVTDERLAAPAQAGDWLGWLQTLQSLERERLAPLQARLRNRSVTDLCLVLTGEERLAILDIRAARGWRRWLRPRAQDWQHWFAAR